MERHFNYGHTIQPSQDDSQSNLDHLFVIGEAKIKMESQSEEKYQEGSDSDETPVLGERRKHKKRVKKDKKNKKDKKRKQGKKKNKRKERKQKRQQLQESEMEEMQIVPYRQLPKPSALLQRYQQQLEAKYAKGGQLQLNTKVGQGLLNVDFVEFPQKQIYQFGLMDREVPQYSRLPFFQQIIGSKHKKQKQIIKFINKKTNQQQINPFSDDISKQRYFQFEGYSDVTSQRLPFVRPVQILPAFIPLGKTQIFAQNSSQQRWLRVTKEYNIKLNQEPSNISEWLQFVDIQQSLSDLAQGPAKSKAVLERQVSILEKALLLNPLNDKLGIVYINKLYERQSDIAILINKCKQFIMSHPSSTDLWLTFLYLQIGQFGIFSHELSRKIFEQTTHLLRTIIDSTRSAVQLWKIRKAGLELVKTYALIYKMQGYGELATGLIIGLMDFNFFMPEEVVKITNHNERVKLFGSYWQDHRQYKLGQTLSTCGWSNQKPTPQQKDQELTFIGSLEDHKLINQTNIYSKETILQQRIWRPSHPILDKQAIEDKPQSYILIQDIDFVLHLYRDNQSLITLIDLLADHLQLPTVFSFLGLHSQFQTAIVQSSLQYLFNNKEVNDFFGEFYWWKRYWNPLMSEQLLKNGKLVKLEYLRRILQTLKYKVPSILNQMNQYLVFINCCYYLNPQLQRKLNQSESHILTQLQTLLGEDSLNVGAWSIYIEVCFIKNSNIGQCIGCYLQLLETVNSMNQGLSVNPLTYEIMHWLWGFATKNKPQMCNNILKLYFDILEGKQRNCFTVQEQLSNSDKIRLQRYLKQKYVFWSEEVSKDQKQMTNYVAISQLPLLILDCTTRGLLQDLHKFRQPVVNLLIALLFKQTTNSQSQHFIICSLICRRFLHKQVIEKDLLKTMPFLILVRYWITLNHKHQVCVLSQFQLMDGKNMALWMAASIFLWTNTGQHSYFHDYFYKMGKQLSFQFKLNKVSPKYMNLFNRYLLYSIQPQCQFLQCSLKQMPYCKQLYLLNIKTQSNLHKRQEILKLMRHKNLRVIQSQLLE